MTKKNIFKNLVRYHKRNINNGYSFLGLKSKTYLYSTFSSTQLWILSQTDRHEDERLSKD